MNQVGIITWHYPRHYGSVLQAYALQETIASIGYGVKIIDYRNIKKYVLIRKLLIKCPSLLTVITSLIYDKRTRNFIHFHNHFLKLTRLFTTQDDLKKSKEQFHVYICGSDQIWSANSLDPVYLLSFIKSDNQKKIAYAPSVVIDDFTETQKEVFRKYINELDFISVREQKGAEIIKIITGREAEVVLDPTFLVTSKEWDRISIEPEIKKKYILCYFLGDNPVHRKIVLEVQKWYGCDILTLPVREKDKEFGTIINTTAGPREFLGLIKNSLFVCTDSFHGITLSINYGKQFYAFYRFSENDPISRNARIDHILQKLDLTSRILREVGDIHNAKEIDYNGVLSTLQKERTNSLKYLSSSLSCSFERR